MAETLVPNVVSSPCLRNLHVSVCVSVYQDTNSAPTQGGWEDRPRHMGERTPE